MLNIPLARKVIEHIEAHPEEHRQEFFAAKLDCGTTACIAGHALLLSGEYGLDALGEDEIEFDFHRTDGSGDFVLTSEAGQEILGLTDEQRDTLFFDLQDEDEALDYLRGLLVKAEQTDKVAT